MESTAPAEGLAQLYMVVESDSERAITTVPGSAERFGRSNLRDVKEPHN
jgi:hypothetical protein